MSRAGRLLVHTMWNCGELLAGMSRRVRCKAAALRVYSTPQVERET